jgi:hypothetical protein
MSRIKPDEEWTQIEYVEILRQTDKAILFVLPLVEGPEKWWLPKSVIDLETLEAEGELQIQSWFAKKEGLAKAKED